MNKMHGWYLAKTKREIKIANEYSADKVEIPEDFIVEILKEHWDNPDHNGEWILTQIRGHFTKSLSLFLLREDLEILS